MFIAQSWSFVLFFKVHLEITLIQVIQRDEVYTQLGKALTVR